MLYYAQDPVLPGTLCTEFSWKRAEKVAEKP